MELGFPWASREADWGWPVGGGERLVQAHLGEAEAPQPRGVCTGAVLDVLLFPKNCSHP